MPLFLSCRARFDQYHCPTLATIQNFVLLLSFLLFRYVRHAGNCKTWTGLDWTGLDCTILDLHNSRAERRDNRTRKYLLKLHYLKITTMHKSNINFKFHRCTYMYYLLNSYLKGVHQMMYMSSAEVRANVCRDTNTGRNKLCFHSFDASEVTVVMVYSWPLWSN